MRKVEKCNLILSRERWVRCRRGGRKYGGNREEMGRKWRGSGERGIVPVEMKANKIKKGALYHTHRKARKQTLREALLYVQKKQQIQKHSQHCCSSLHSSYSHYYIFVTLCAPVHLDPDHQSTFSFHFHLLTHCHAVLTFAFRSFFFAFSILYR